MGQKPGFRRLVPAKTQRLQMTLAQEAGLLDNALH
jgi:hypothetical protein